MNLLVFSTLPTVFYYVIYVHTGIFSRTIRCIFLCHIDWFKWILKFRKGNVPTFVTIQCLMGK